LAGDNWLIDVIETAVKIARKRLIDQCVIECCRTGNVNQCFAECTDKYSNYNGFTKPDYIKALVYTGIIYRQDITMLLNILENNNYIEKKGKTYIITSYTNTV